MHENLRRHADAMRAALPRAHPAGASHLEDDVEYVDGKDPKHDNPTLYLSDTSTHT